MKVSYANLKLKVDDSVKKVNINDNTEIEILQYLPIADKYDLVMITLQQSEEIDGTYNPIRLDMYFHLYLVYMYTNITFTEKQKENEEKIFDTLMSNGIIETVIANIPENEYIALQDFIEEIISDRMTYKMSTANLLSKFIEDLPGNAEAALDIVNNFDPNKFEAVKNFAEAANGGRAIATLE